MNQHDSVKQSVWLGSTSAESGCARATSIPSQQIDTTIPVRIRYIVRPWYDGLSTGAENESNSWISSIPIIGTGEKRCFFH